jgi:hypothetical protein
MATIQRTKLRAGVYSYTINGDVIATAVKKWSPAPIGDHWELTAHTFAVTYPWRHTLADATRLIHAEAPCP